MSLVTKAGLLVACTMLVTLLSGLLARNYILNPHLLSIEREADQRDIERFTHAIDHYRENLESRIKRIYAAAGVLQNLGGTINWSPIVLNLAHIGGYEELDYFILADKSGDNAVMRAGELVDKEDTPPSPRALNEVLKKIISQLDSTDGATTSGLMVSQADGPLVYAAGRASWNTDKLPAIYAAVRRLSPAMIEELGEHLGLSVEALSLADSKNQRKHYGVGLGQRSDADTLYAELHDRNDNHILSLKFNTAPRAFDERTFSPTIVAAMSFSILAWGLILLVMRHSIVKPIQQLTATMRRVRQTSNYGERFEYRHRDELGKLVDECNELLNHVGGHTQQLENYSYKDSLTGIGNRRLFQERLDYQWRLSQRKHTPLSAIVFDLDYFKQYNDLYGHEGGDTVLKVFASLLQEVFTRDTDVVARTGGEEFIVLLLDADYHCAELMAERTLNALRQRHIPHAGAAHRGQVSASAGVSSLTPDESNSQEQLIRQADKALYRAKQLGRDNVAVYESSSLQLINHTHKSQP